MKLGMLIRLGSEACDLVQCDVPQTWSSAVPTRSNFPLKALPVPPREFHLCSRQRLFPFGRYLMRDWLAWKPLSCVCQRWWSYSCVQPTGLHWEMWYGGQYVWTCCLRSASSGCSLDLACPHVCPDLANGWYSVGLSSWIGVKIDDGRMDRAGRRHRFALLIQHWNAPILRRHGAIGFKVLNHERDRI
jgi:hypothetical protein